MTLNLINFVEIIHLKQKKKKKKTTESLLKKAKKKKNLPRKGMRKNIQF